MLKRSIGKLVSVFLLSMGMFLITSCMSPMSGWEGQPPTGFPESEKPEEVYNVGERGPSGGFIFYDKGTYSDGWRYLEAAPSLWSEPKAQWGARPFNNVRLKDGFGDGLDNTKHIVDYNKHIQENLETYKQLPESEQVFPEAHDGSVAAALCLDASINGLEDWYLPSLDELLSMRNTLYINDLGSFQADLYWSSSMSGDRSGTMVNFYNGMSGGSYTDTSYYVRPIRRF